MAYYKDLREFVRVLKEQNKLVRVEKEINKDTELMPLVRWQFRGLSEEQRRAFLFENVTDAKGKKYNGSVLVASHGASTQIYALGMMCKPEEILEKWNWAQTHPIEPVMVQSGAFQEEIHVGDRLQEHGGLAEFPVPISTPGFDNAPYFSAANWVTKDPDTGVRNVGNYRAMVKSQTRTGIRCVWPQHLRQHWEKCQEKGIPLQAAMVVGLAPHIGYVAVTKFPYGVDEYTVAGGISGEPVELVKCQTVDIEVPAAAEIVIEGQFSTDSLEREGPFGEHTGYLLGQEPCPYFNVTCIAHRKNPISMAFISQFPPSESSKIRVISSNAVLYHLLKHERGIEGIKDVSWHEESGAFQFLVISMRKAYPAQVWQALKEADAYESMMGKMIIAVDEDIDARDPDSVIWALCYHMQPHRDILITQGKAAHLDPSAGPPGADLPPGYASPPTSSILIDATRKWDYPPTALPTQEFMERAKAIWEALGLPTLSPKSPWYGRSFGAWIKRNENEAELAIKGEYFQTGDYLSKNERIKL